MIFKTKLKQQKVYLPEDSWFKGGATNSADKVEGEVIVLQKTLTELLANAKPEEAMKGGLN